MRPAERSAACSRPGREEAAHARPPQVLWLLPEGSHSCASAPALHRLPLHVAALFSWGYCPAAVQAGQAAARSGPSISRIQPVHVVIDHIGMALAVSLQGASDCPEIVPRRCQRAWQEQDAGVKLIALGVALSELDEMRVVGCQDTAGFSRGVSELNVAGKPSLPTA